MDDAHHRLSSPVNRGQQLQCLSWLRDHGIPAPVFEHEFHPDRRWRFDLAWPFAMLALEIEGGIYGGRDPATGRRFKGAHGSISGIKRDIQKYNAGVVLGWAILRVLPDELYTQGTVDMVSATLKRR